MISIACSSSKQAVLVPNVELSRDTLQKADNAYIEALKERTLENYNQAYALFHKALSLNPRIDAAYFELAKLDQEKDLDLAILEIQKAIYLDPSNHYYLEFYAILLKKNKDYKKAEMIYSQLHDLKPKDIAYIYEMANQQINQGKIKSSLKTMDIAEEVIGNTEELAIQREKIYRAIRQPEKALEAIKHYVGEDPKDVRKLELLAESYKASEMEDEYIQTLEKIEELDKNNGKVLLYLSDFYGQKGDKEKHKFYQMKAFNSKHINYDAKMRVLYQYASFIGKDEELTKEALELARILTEVNIKEASAHDFYARLLYQRNQFELAKSYAKTACKLNPKNSNHWNLLLTITGELEQHKELIEYADSALILFPNQNLIYYQKGFSQLRLKQYEKVIPVLKKGLDVTFDNVNLQSEFNSMLGQAYHELKEYKNSDKHYRNCLELDSNNVFVLNNYSYYLSLRKDQLEYAAKLSKRSNQLQPNSQSFEDTYAWILFQLGRYEEALIWINKSIQHGGAKSAVIVEHKGDILFKLGETSQALEHWKMAKTLGKASDMLDKKIEDKKWYE